MKVLHIAVREDDEGATEQLLARLCEVASEGQRPADDPDAYVYRAWAEDVRYVPAENR